MGGCLGRDLNGFVVGSELEDIGDSLVGSQRRHRQLTNRRRLSNLSDSSSSHNFVNVTQNKPLRYENNRWKSDIPLTESQLKSKRDEFWDTAPAFEGKEEIWTALKAATELTSKANYNTDDNAKENLQFAQAILDGAGISLPHGSLSECYDELGNRYTIPVYCFSNPINIITDESYIPIEYSEHLNLIEKEGREFKIKVRVSLSDKDIKMLVNSSESVASCKKQLHLQNESVPESSLQRWYFGGKLLQDKTKISKSGVVPGNVIQSSCSGMSIVHTTSKGWFLSHQDYIDKSVKHLGLESKSIFDVLTPFRMDLEAERISRFEDKKFKKKKKNQSTIDNWIDIKFLCSEFLNELKEKEGLFKDLPDSSIIKENNRKVRELVKSLETEHHFYKHLFPITKKEFDENVFDKNLKTNFVIPQHCNFLLQNLDSSSLEILSAGGTNKFDLILMDPPWENKYIKREQKRNKGYKMVSNWDIGKIEINKLFSDDSIIVIWCTNSPRHQKAVIEWFKKWGIVQWTRWFWLKVTQSGEPVVSFDKTHKVPFEVLFVGSKTKEPSLQHNKIVCSIPSAIHSHKPPLIEAINVTLGRKRKRCLELFGRYLIENWTTLGNQCLKFQEKKYFKKI